ncbi:MAG TPA: glutathione peroxidase [Ferruginibacter sp.]|nr:glutathione peroxidase [Ferruginibacter sp.]HMW27701.1 glutathione peroxidase [Ferruginibacter sp.]HNA16856.1 glutathione peroxidase [Ferruginibacter sp.]
MTKLFITTLLLCGSFFSPAVSQTRSIYDFKVAGLDGDTIDFAQFKGKKILIVNTASKCGFTPQYEDLEKLYKTYKDKLVIVGFPANNFFSQEPGSNETISEFCKKNYGVSFPMAAKISVKGKNIAPIYKWLCDKEENGVMDAKISWNFNKFLLDENGKIIAHFKSAVKPMSEEIVSRL